MSIGGPLLRARSTVDAIGTGGRGSLGEERLVAMRLQVAHGIGLRTGVVMIGRNGSMTGAGNMLREAYGPD